MTELDAARISTASPHVAEDTARATVLVWGIAAVVAALVVAVGVAAWVLA